MCYLQYKIKNNMNRNNIDRNNLLLKLMDL